MKAQNIFFWSADTPRKNLWKFSKLGFIWKKRKKDKKISQAFFQISETMPSVSEWKVTDIFKSTLSSTLKLAYAEENMLLKYTYLEY